MKRELSFAAFVLVIVIPLIFNNCSGGSGSSSSGTSGLTINPVQYPLSPSLSITGAEANVMPVSVGCGYTNEPCVSVKICRPGTSSCVTVNNILLDTGSFGLRVFSDQVASITLPAEIDPGTGLPIAECMSYADGASDWGPVVTADVYLGNGNERAPGIPVQIINANYATLPSNCTNPDLYSLASGNVNNVGFNGILGVGFFASDCGSECVSDPGNQVYYVCNGTLCGGAAVQYAMQVSNPVSYLTTPNVNGGYDNNGVILQLPGVASGGASSLSGYLILGVGTQGDNMPPAGVTTFQADANANFQTYYSGQLFSDTNGSTASYIDSGSNGLYFQDNTLPQCSDGSGFFCPATPVDLFADMIGANNTPQDLVPFEVANGMNENNSSNVAFNNLAGYAPGVFDWGFPFFLGKTVYVGFDQATSPIGTGPFWGF